jgi:integrase
LCTDAYTHDLASAGVVERALIPALVVTRIFVQVCLALILFGFCETKPAGGGTMIKIRKITLKSGETRYCAYGVSTGTDPVTGKRRQRTITRRLKKEVEAELASRRLPEKRRTRLGGKHQALLQAGPRTGPRVLRPAQGEDRVREDVERYRDWLRTEGRRRGGTPGTALSARSVNLSLQQLQAAYALGEADGKIATNPARYIKREEKEYVTWDESEVRTFLAEASSERLAACWLLSALCLRRGEVLGLKWSYIDFAAGTLHVGVRTRVLVNGEVVEKCAKSKALAGHPADVRPGEHRADEPLQPGRRR